MMAPTMTQPRWPLALAAMERAATGDDDAEAIDHALRKLWRAAECERIDCVMRQLLDEAGDLLEAAGLPDLAVYCEPSEIEWLILKLEARV